MVRKLLALSFLFAFAICITGCEENEHKVTEKREYQTESEPTDSSPGEMIVE